MKGKMMKKFIAGALGALLIAAGAVTTVQTAAYADDGPIVVTSKADAPKSTVWTPGDVNQLTCMVTDTGVNVVSGNAAETHDVYKYQRTVTDYKTQYHFRKFTHTKTKAADERGFWQEFSPNNSKKFQGPPTWPSDSRGTWSSKKYNGGPDQSASGVFQSGHGHGSWFYRQQTVTHDWTDYGPWTAWTPETHTSWQDSNIPLGTPEFHGEGTYQDGTKWYREWQAQFDGETRQVENGSHVETSDWVESAPDGDGWVLIDTKQITDTPATDDVTTTYSYTHRDQACTTAVSYIETSATQVCGSATVTLHNVSPWIYPVTFVVDDGAPIYGATVDNRTDGKLTGPVQDASNSKTFTFDEDSGVHTIKYVVNAGTENKLYKGLAVGEWTTLTVDSDCEPNVPEQPVDLTGVETQDLAPVCVTPLDGTATVEHQERTWIQPVDQWNAETWAWEPGEKVYTDWTTVSTSVVSDEVCAEVVVPPTDEPTEEPTVDPTPTPTETPVVTPPTPEKTTEAAVVTAKKVTPRAAKVVATQEDDLLAETGGDLGLTIGLSIAGAFAVALGGLGVLAAMGATRMRRRNQ